MFIGFRFNFTKLCITILMFFIIALQSNSTYSQIKEKIELKAKPFSLADVKLYDSPFKKAMDAEIEYLLFLNPDRLLSWFRKEAGLQPKADNYGGWENEGLAGHSLGHYLSACSMAYAVTGNDSFLQKINYIIDELEIIQKANGDGYLGAIPKGKQIFKEVSEGNIRSKGFDLNGGWSPWYTLHKMFAGLIDAHKYCNNKKALDLAVIFADWAYNITGSLSEEQFQKMLVCEYGGMNEVLAELYSITGNEKYLSLSRKFHDKFVLNPLTNKEDKLNGMHANTQVPKLIGIARRYEITGDVQDKIAPEFFWDRVVHHHSYVIGGNSSNEYFGEPGKFSKRLGENTCETCNTYNMLKLTKLLFSWNPDAHYADYYERALYNHILASQNSADGMTCYFMPMKPGSHKTFSDKENSFWCCTGTGMENHVKYGEAIYFHNDNDLWVNLFICSEVNWKEKDIRINQQTDYPENDKTEFIIRTNEPTELNLNIRYPKWAKDGVYITINDELQEVFSKPGSYITICRKWKDRDIIKIYMPMSLTTETLPDNKDKAALLYGPIVLAGELGALDDSLARNFDYTPVMITNGKPLTSMIDKVDGKRLTFKTVNAGVPRDVELKPYYSITDKRYSIYWDTFTNEQWEKKKADYIAELEQHKRLEELTIDFVQPGEMQPERDHNMQGEKTTAGESWGGKWRAAENGWFSFDMKVIPDKLVDLICTYWGSYGGARNFNILVDGEKIASESLHYNKPDEFFDSVYKVPEHLTKGKEKVTIRFEALPANTAGGLFGLRVVKNIIEN